MAAARQIQFRIGINLGDVISEDGDIFGDGVNVAARLQELAEPGGICVSGAVRALTDKPSIAVLPFVNMSGDPEQEFFADDLTEDIITALSRFGDLFVVSRNSAFVHKGKAVKVHDVAREFGVQYVVEAACASWAIACASPSS